MNTKKNNKKLSKNFISTILEISGGYFTSEQLDKFFNSLETEIGEYAFVDSSEANLLRIINGMYNKRTFIDECLKFPHYIEIIVAISANSNYLTDILVRDPEYFYWIVNPSVLKSKLNTKIFTESLEESLRIYNFLPAKLNAIRAIKRKEILKIGLKDILGQEDLYSITEELSILAKSITSILFNICYNEISKKYKVSNLNHRYCLIALGKLGGNELNYSSDIDLMIFYDINVKVTEKKDYHEFLTEVIQLFIESATSITNAGYVYRVDFRLRPDGKNSPLCNTYDSYINYYESRGQDWERQMLTKASLICGDNNLFYKFSDYLSHFIYPESFTTSPLDQIKKLKLAIEKKLKDEGNIKLTPGGIRNIEFSVQALQLLNGGRFPEIRTPNTLEAIKKLERHNLLTKNESEIFNETYTFYRKIEHFLQLMNDTQTHTIPVKGLVLNCLSSFLGFSSPENFLKKVSLYRTSVLDIYNSIVGIKKQKEDNSSKARISFKNKVKAEKDLDFLRTGKGLLNQNQFDKTSTAAFHKIEDNLITYLSDSKSPDIILQNFTRIIRDTAFPSIWYSEFTDQKFFSAFLTICEYSQKAVDLFAEDNNLREYFLTKKIFEKLNTEKIKKLDTKTFLFHLLCVFTLKIIQPQKGSKLLKDFFIERIKHLSEKSLAINENNYFIAALGSFGSGEMSFASDIDLIFVVNKSDKANDSEKQFQTFLSMLKKEFYPFAVDCRLRPEGKSSQLVWELDSYIEYLSKRGRTWEFQSLCKLNLVSGDKLLFNKFAKAVTMRITNFSKKELKKDIFEMRKKLYPQDISGLTDVFNVKRSRGGIVDLEFVLQYLMLSDPKYFSASKGKTNVQVIEILSKTNKSMMAQKENLVSGYYFLKKLELANQSIFNVSNSQIRLENERAEKVISFLEINSLASLKNNLSKTAKLNITLFGIFFSTV